MSLSPAPAVVVMAKAPRQGMVKTRLHPLLGPQRCAALQTELIRHALETTSGSRWRTYPAHTPYGGPDDGRHLAPVGVRLLVQRGADLGQRLAAAVTDAFADGAGPLVVIGTDAPTLTGDHVACAFAALESRDVVLGPAPDGGHHLIGLRAPHTGLFALDPAWWSTDNVLAATRALTDDAGLRTELGTPLRDLDTPEDAAALLADPALPPGIAALLKPTETV
ncbi:TIGR04282 family arsenosugar biosynthesis glycosyltransferase [Streptomyces sp. TRM70350]|uniref:TIGR04282 family arsenosugar biosynthesis glycosyltransferase n=1 Tax=Streptomyces sp. TRM70350 TaxID=2856165 RepID=UPI001C48AD0F|nr:TIGR04282 family arsenosugar biosynthesis glycosyltransferase [Streptomyces sp. TRM70350]MBV7697459.1 TIGR04282 family arsenosugar biosynthesis glycosyltransferase [Streptomyces sp. TRM70350]